MKIAVNTRLLLPDRLEGIGWFAHETLQRITRDHPEHEFLFLFDRPYDDRFVYGENVTPLVIGPMARHPILFYIWFELRIPAVLRKHKIDLFLSPDGYLSLNTNVPQLAVMHDINFEYFPEYVPFAARLHYRYFFKKYAAKAARIATVSEYSKRDISTLYQVNAEKIDVVYNGANEAFSHLAENEIQAVRTQFSEGQPYFLFVGLIHPRKNLANQLRAFDIFRKRSNRPYKFLVIGARYYKDRELDDVLKLTNFREDIIFLGRQNQDVLVKLYGAAFALMYVSQFEGFGIPIVEAMRAEVPVITSVKTAMPEVCGDAGLLADPDSPEQIAACMTSLHTNPDLRKKLIAAGMIQREKFSWEKTAAALWSSVKKASGI